MCIAFLLFWLLIVWGLYDGDIELGEGAVFAAIWIGLLLGALLVPGLLVWFTAPLVLLDIILILKVFGQDIRIR